MHSGDSGKNVVVGGMGLEDAVFDDGNIAVGAFGDDVSAVEDAFAAAGFLRFLRGHYVYKKI